MGNPLNYRDGMSFAWENGRWLKTITKNGNDIEMKYDINGMRTQKGNTYYYYDTDNNLIAMVKGNDTLHFYYDSNNSPIAFTRNNVMYYYVKNIQGDIIKIVNEDGSLAYTYDYDAWGALLSIKGNYGHTISGNSTSLATTTPSATAATSMMMKQACTTYTLAPKPEVYCINIVNERGTTTANCAHSIFRQHLFH